MICWNHKRSIREYVHGLMSDISDTEIIIGRLTYSSFHYWSEKRLLCPFHVTLAIELISFSLSFWQYEFGNQLYKVKLSGLALLTDKRTQTLCSPWGRMPLQLCCHHQCNHVIQMFIKAWDRSLFPSPGCWCAGQPHLPSMQLRLSSPVGECRDGKGDARELQQGLD